MGYIYDATSPMLHVWYMKVCVKYLLVSITTECRLRMNMIRIVDYRRGSRETGEQLCLCFVGTNHHCNTDLENMHAITKPISIDIAKAISVGSCYLLNGFLRCSSFNHISS